MESNSTPSTPSPSRALEAAVALTVGIGAVAGSYAAVGARPTFLAAPVAEWVTALTPDAVVTWAILTLGNLGQSLGFALALVLCVLAVAAVTVGSRAVARGTSADPLVTHALTALAVGGGTAALTGGPLSAVGAAVGAGVVSLSTHRVGSPPADSPPDRRGFLRSLVAATAVTGAGAFLGTRPSLADTSGGAAAGASEEGSDAGDTVVDDLLATASVRTLDLPDLDPLVSRDFYQVDINSVDPDLSVDEWSLRLTGAVDEERTFDYDRLTELPAQHRFVTLQCVGDGLNGKKIDTALWTGVPIAELLPDLPDECCVMLRAADDYYEEFPMAALRNGFVAYRMNGRPLPRGHGYPVRALIPG
ncbi:molybdopterin-dependent oxidoreductase, partial [Salinigranum sp.]|uniref:molybdopterin-dependent oxidoreductase n=1 Tax=Salinigranum sp. TaxID=1966351 RepID=UPI00356836F1